MAGQAPLHGIPGRLLELVGALREAGVPVSISDDLDAMRALAAVDLLDRETVREALAACVVGSPSQRVIFDTLFDLYFPRTHRLPGEEPAPPGADGDLDIDQFLRDLLRALEEGDDAALRRLARDAVERLAAVDNADGSRSFFAYRVYRNFNTNGVLRRMLMETGLDGRDDLEARLARDEIAARLERFRAEIDAELRRRQAEERGAEEVARRSVRPPPEQIDFFSVTAAEQDHMRKAVRPLARRLATRLAVKRRRARRGRLDVRKTLRRALATGGTPIDPALKARKAHRPDLVLICDVSGSVAAFAKFTLLFAHSLQGQFTRVRSFAFIDTVDEVTDFFADGDVTEAMTRTLAEADLVWLDGHSDYGHAFDRFTQVHADALNPRTTVLVLGDARNNYRAAHSWALAEITHRAKRTYWLNPEPRSQWDTGDSIASEYGRVVDAMVECRNLAQLAAFVEQLA